ncbi:MAG: HepT-like ribonuclease domain-containing protein [Gammaproteobacteria bacterium]
MSEREWRFYLDDMIGFAEKVLAYTEGFDQTAFVASGLNYDATVRNLELIGEAATNVPQPLRDAAPQIPWRLIIATRNRLIHGYLGIDNDTLWSIVRDDIPALLPELRKLKHQVR